MVETLALAYVETLTNDIFLTLPSFVLLLKEGVAFIFLAARRSSILAVISVVRSALAVSFLSFFSVFFVPLLDTLPPTVFFSVKFKVCVSDYVPFTVTFTTPL